MHQRTKPFFILAIGQQGYCQHLLGPALLPASTMAKLTIRFLLPALLEQQQYILPILVLRCHSAIVPLICTMWCDKIEPTF
jgi:hypothetical protein